MDNAIISRTLTHWIVIYPVDSAIECLNNGARCSTTEPQETSGSCVNILCTAMFGMQKGAWHMCSVTNVMAHCRLTLYNFTDVTAVVRVRQRDVHPAHPPRHIFVMQ